MEIKAVPEKETGNWLAVVWPYIWVLLLSIWGGVVNFIHKLRTGTVKRFSFTELVGEVVTSGFAGIITYFFCQYAQLNQWVTAALVGIAGHMGSRGIFKMEQWLTRRFGP